MATIDGDGQGAGTVSRDPGRARRVAALLATGRVGGGFWGMQATGRPRLIVTGPGGTLPEGDLADSVVVVDASLRCDTHAALRVGRDVDPWSLIAGAALVIADPADEIAVLAGAAGCVVHDLSGRPVVDPDFQRLDDALLRGRRYRDPFTGDAITVEAAIALLAFWRTTIDANRGLAAATGMARWKRREIARLLWDGRADDLPFMPPAAAIALAAGSADAGRGAVAAWPSRVPADFGVEAADTAVPVRWVEDGFLRSAGLGSDLNPPLSIAVDDLAPYYDPSRPSRIETILATHPFPDELVARAAALRTRIVDGGVGKYGVAGPAADLPDLPAGRRVVLVAGQVEDDESVLRGGGGVTGNLDLLRRARAAEPGAWILYRPHPDVEAGHRRGAVADDDARRHADAVVRGGSLAALIDRADAVHVLTSLTGFEALLRHREVVVHGQPFFAGWGLTRDIGLPLGRRMRRLTLDQLVAGVLILYPRYLDPRHGLPCPPEVFITGIASTQGRPTLLTRLRRTQGRVMRLLAG
ncbi:hypothetical protein ASE75_02575 [Sphingomonas sp. Leaf17]|uniref:capsular polysaccharide export protein, LipB/KpsS family n=1 Tax=Sphingomonas sp. Leaf17 TaxID=1735683 RepID=UPI0006F61785|nr:beta-3-deoxy-D-manno-oct-2-ulosonic acid transferase [Sphingomonas sp. Leaf17]KQM67803.1 hypothetical protein ASE75_02575 [Sphingomonas sp. Leaf17]